jgi:hypothetical protein
MAYIGKHERTAFWSRNGDKVSFAGFFSMVAGAIALKTYDAGSAAKQAIDEHGVIGAGLEAIQNNSIDLSSSPYTAGVFTVGVVGSLASLVLKRRPTTRETPQPFIPLDIPVSLPLQDLNTVILPIVHATPKPEPLQTAVRNRRPGSGTHAVRAIILTNANRYRMLDLSEPTVYVGSFI